MRVLAVLPITARPIADVRSILEMQNAATAEETEVADNRLTPGARHSESLTTSLVVRSASDYTFRTSSGSYSSGMGT